MGVVDRMLIEEVVGFTGGNQSQAARILGISRPTLVTAFTTAAPRLEEIFRSAGGRM